MSYADINAWEAKKKQFEALKEQMNGIISSCDSLSGSVVGVKNCMSQVIIDGQPYDKGKLNSYNGTFSSAKSAAATVISAANAKIGELNNKIIAERNRLKKLENSGSSSTSTSKNAINNGPINMIK